MTLQSDKLAPAENFGEQFPTWWNQWVRQAAKNIALNHEYILKQASRKIPTLFV